MTIYINFTENATTASFVIICQACLYVIKQSSLLSSKMASTETLHIVYTKEEFLNKHSKTSLKTIYTTKDTVYIYVKCLCFA